MSSFMIEIKILLWFWDQIPKVRVNITVIAFAFTFKMYFTIQHQTYITQFLV